MSKGFMFYGHDRRFDRDILNQLFTILYVFRGMNMITTIIRLSKLSLDLMRCKFVSTSLI